MFVQETAFFCKMVFCLQENTSFCRENASSWLENHAWYPKDRAALTKLQRVNHYGLRELGSYILREAMEP